MSDPRIDEPKPTHEWRGSDGHDCADCPTVSMWKCDRLAHPIKGGVMGVFGEAERRDIQRQLDPMFAPSLEGARHPEAGETPDE